jgi:hypothetical protein
MNMNMNQNARSSVGNLKHGNYDLNINIQLDVKVKFMAPCSDS